MKVSLSAETLLSGAKPKIIQGDDYVIKIILPFAIRYLAHEKVLTLPVELKQQEGSWWFFRSYFAVNVRIPVCWDNELDPLSVREAELILDRLSRALDRGYKLEFVREVE